MRCVWQPRSERDWPIRPRHIRGAALAAPALLMVMAAGCATANERAADERASTGHTVAADTGVPDAQEAFWSNMQQHCERAYRGGLVLEPPGDEMLTGDEELIAHFRECDELEMTIPFHIELEDGEWDRSRTWVLRRYDGAIELRHDHRQPDGSEDDVTWYGGFARTAGTPTSQEFVYEERRADDGSELGWRLEILPGERYSYGTIRGGEWTWRVDFDLSQPVPAPPAPWGHEEVPR